MSENLSYRRFALGVAALLFLAVFFSSVSKTWATDTTYNIANYPSMQPDMWNDGDVNISGTLTENINTYGYPEITSGSITYQSPIATYTGTFIGIAGYASYGSAIFTPTQYLAPEGTATTLVFMTTQGDEICLRYWNMTATNGDYEGAVFSPSDQLIDDFWGLTGGALSGNDPWVIATAVPEPGTITLLGTALLGFAGVLYLRRRLVCIDRSRAIGI